MKIKIIVVFILILSLFSVVRSGIDDKNIDIISTNNTTKTYLSIDELEKSDLLSPSEYPPGTCELVAKKVQEKYDGNLVLMVITKDEKIYNISHMINKIYDGDNYYFYDYVLQWKMNTKSDVKQKFYETYGVMYDIYVYGEDYIPFPISENFSSNVPDKPTNIPFLKKDNQRNTLSGITQPSDPSSYITPDNEWIKYYANQIFINEDGVLLYKIREPYPVVSYTSFVNNYITDEEQFGVEDYWINSDYYLTHNMTGDCEDFAITVANMMLSGDISASVNGSFVKQKILAKVMIGYYKGFRHTWTEYNVYNNTYISHSEGNYYVFDTKQGSLTEYIKKDTTGNDFIPKFEFTSEYFKEINI